MNHTAEFKKIRDLLEQRYGHAGFGASQLLEQWLTGRLPMCYPEVTARLLREDAVDLLFDSFWQVVPFGTGGRRGPVGYGPNRINPTTVALSVQGHCDYLLSSEHSSPIAVVVANDVRVFRDKASTYSQLLGPDHPLLGYTSRDFAKLACEIYAANGVRVYLSEPESQDAVMATPMLSFAIRQLRTAGGVNFSASHNPPDDNGIKVYNRHGGQPIPPHDQSLADRIAQVTTATRMPFAEALRSGMIAGLPPDITEAYVRTYTDIYANGLRPDPHVPIVYTPLCGCGLTTAGLVLRKLSFPILVPPDQYPDGSFTSIPLYSPNPEVPQATLPAQAYADRHDSGIVVSSDPDADRVGADVRLRDRTWYHLDGNQIAAVLAYFLMLDRDGPGRSGLLIKTAVTSSLLREIAARAGAKIVDGLLVGFKYIADVLQALTERGQFGDVACKPEDLVIAAEESHGVLLTPLIRDKDAAGAVMYLCSLYQRLHRSGLTLLDYYATVLGSVGVHDCVNRSIMLRGATGIAKRDRLMSSLRENPPSQLAGAAVTAIVDHLDEERYGPPESETDRESRNVLELQAEGLRVVVRPSGTEPKIKFYCEVSPARLIPPAGETLNCDFVFGLRRHTERFANRVYLDLLSRLGITLGEPALDLPDIVDLEQKVRFEVQTLRELQRALQTNESTTLNGLLDWLRGQTKDMTRGADSLPAIRKAVATALREWHLTGENALQRDFGRWARNEIEA